MKVVAWIVFVLIGAWACSAFTGEDSSDGPSGDAWLACQEAVESQLSYPATADFSLLGTTMEEAAIRGSLTATNAYGTPVELGFRCGISGDEVTSADVWER